MINKSKLAAILEDEGLTKTARDTVKAKVIWDFWHNSDQAQNKAKWRAAEKLSPRRAFYMDRPALGGFDFHGDGYVVLQFLGEVDGEEWLKLKGEPVAVNANPAREYKPGEVVSLELSPLGSSVSGSSFSLPR